MSEDLTKKLPQSDSEKLTLILSTVQTLTVRVEKLEETRYQTRPMWEKLVTDIEHLQEGQEALRTEVREIKTSIRDLSRRFSIFNDTLVTIQVDYRDIYDRVRSLERGHNPSNTET